MGRASIVAAGAYIPVLRLSRDAIAQAWGRSSLGGERAVANHDEDSLTMAVEAASDCLAGTERREIDALYFASTTAPYREKQSAALLAAALDLREEVTTTDFGNSLRAGTNALLAAFHAVSAGAVGSALVVAADCRLGYPRSDQEQTFGDAAAAVLVRNVEGGATLASSFSSCHAMMDVWRKDADTFVQSWEDRWVQTEGWAPAVDRALRAALERADLPASEIGRLVLSGGSVASQKRFVTGLSMPAANWQDNFAGTVGDAGAAHALLGLSDALHSVPKGAVIAVVAYGDGADALVLRAGEVRQAGSRRGVRGFLSSKLPLPSYQRYLSARNLVEIAPGEPFRLYPSATASWRDEASALRCRASRCRQCGTTAFPIQRVCHTCRSKDDFEEVRLSDQRGTVFTYSVDTLAGRGDDPTIVQTVVEMDGSKARVYALMTDCDPWQVSVGMPVELTFRRLYEGAGFYNYFWKCRPVRGGER
ncbi:MAG: hydroxymethylglutaryl-CoA synthase family protein [Deltaproteobacteria bacterium]|nr:hydroxymethylglutaryl-CoA synthase family protein [Deltaproteobacteria bacterium]